MKSKAIVINRHLKKEELVQIARLKNETPVFVLDSRFDLPFNVLEVELESYKKKELNYSVLSRLLALGDKKIKGKRVAGYFDFGSGNAWYYHKFRIYFYIRNLLYELEKLEKVRENFDQVFFYCDGRFRELSGEIPGVDFIHDSIQSDPINFKVLFNYMLFFVFRSLTGFFHSSKGVEKILVEAEKRSPVLDLQSLEPAKGNYLSDYLLEKSGEQLAVFSEIGVPKFKGAGRFPLHSSFFSGRRKRAQKFYIEHLLFRGFLSSEVRKKAKEKQKEIEGSYNKLITLSDDLFDKLVFMHYKKLHATTCFFIWKNLAFVQFFEKRKIKALLASDENSPAIKTILDAARYCKVPTVGLQHGAIHDLHPAYLYTAEDKEQKVMADFTLVWGDYWKDFLVQKGNFPPESVQVVGQVRTDIIPRLKNEKRSIARVPSGKKIVVFASQPQRDPELRRRAAFDVFASVSALNNAFLVVKLHPNEFHDVDYYKKIAEEAQCKNYTIDRSTDLYLLISQCSLLITCFSTVGTETVYFKKPLIILDHLAQDIQGYKKEGVAFQATSQQELKQTIEGVLAGNLLIKEELQKKFIEKYACKIDGKVSERILTFLDEII